MSPFSLLFTSPGSFDEGGGMQNKLKILKELAQGLIGVIDSQLVTFDKEDYPKIHSELEKQADILVRIISKINRIERMNLYEDKDEITLVHVEVEKFDAKTKDIRSLAQGFMLRM